MQDKLPIRRLLFRLLKFFNVFIFFHLRYSNDNERLEIKYMVGQKIPQN